MRRTVIKLSEDEAKELEIFRIRVDGLNQLFSSYMNDKFDLYNEFKIDEFLDKYSETKLVYESLFNSYILRELGKDGYEDYISPCIGKCRFFNYPEKQIVIIWHDEKEQQ
jgi:hypothetical protein